MIIPFSFIGQPIILSSEIPALTGLYSFTSFTFHPVRTIGRNGPTQATLLAAYSGSAAWVTSSANFYAVSGSQYWTVPQTGTYRIRAQGAQGSNPGSAANGGPGAILQADFQLTQGTKYSLVIGQTAVNTGRENLSSSGGGGTFMVLSGSFVTASILIIAGGGGGTNSDTPLRSYGSTHTSGSASSNGGAGGQNGNGGAVVAGSGHGAGAGFLTNGAGDSPGFSYLSSSLGAIINATYAVNGGGFGGGGAPSNGLFSRCSGGGGFSGGGASSLGSGNNISTAGLHGGGGGSYINASALNVSSSDGRYNGSTTFQGNSIFNLNSYNKSSGSILITLL